MKTKKVPLRKCVICGEQFKKNELLRVVLDEDNLPIIDPTGKKNGRGAYLCYSPQCKKNIKSIERLVRGLRGIIDTGRTEEILEYINEHSKGVVSDEEKSV